MSNPYQLYLVTDDNQDINTLTEVVRSAVAGGVTMVQIREKQGDVRRFIERASAVKQVLKGTEVPLIVNDRVDVALAVDAEGVHLGQTDMPVRMARKLLGQNKILGLSIENEHQLEEAESLPIDYIGLSAIFSTPTKTNTLRHWGLEGLKWALAHSSYPVVAIGGINPTNLVSVSETGVQGIALVSAICHAKNPELAAKDIRSILDKRT